MTTLKTFVRNAINVLAALLLVALAAGIGFFGPITRAAFGETAAQSVSLVEIGNSFTTEDGGKNVPIFAVMLGNTKKAEMLAYNWSQHFGPWSLDAALYVRPADKPAGTWKKAAYHRPKNADEAKKWFDRKEDFYEEAYGDIALLPEPFRGLPAEELAKVEFITAYFDGSTKVYVKSWTSPEDAKALFEAIERARNK